MYDSKDSYGSDLKFGQPNYRKSKNKETASEFFKLGKTKAGLDRQQKDIEQGLQLTMIQQAQLSESKNELKDLMAEFQRMMEASAMPAMSPGPPVGPGMEPPVGMAPGMAAEGQMVPPPEMGGIPPQAGPSNPPPSMV